MLKLNEFVAAKGLFWQNSSGGTWVVGHDAPIDTDAVYRMLA